MGIPKWIVEMRHSIVHANIVVDRDVIYKALKFCEKWIYDNYWVKIVNKKIEFYWKPPIINTKTEKSDLKDLGQFIKCINGDKNERISEIFKNFEHRYNITSQ